MKKRKESKMDFEVNFDSLMDILTCVIGIMLFVVVFTVIQVRGVNVKMFTPLLREPPKGTTRKLFICSKKEIKFLDMDTAVSKLLKGIEHVNFYNVPSFVKKANRKNIHDFYFQYKLDYKTYSSWSFQRREIYIIITPFENIRGETLEDIKKNSSRFKRLIESLDPKKNWISFLVDEESIRLFKEARKLALQRGFKVGWDPLIIPFPHKECIVGCGGRSGRGIGGGIL